jgi:hypothetical protein
MTNEISKPKPVALDNFGTFDDSVEGDDNSRVGGMLTGTRLKYDEEKWAIVSGDDFTDRVLLAGNIRRMEVKWIDGRPAPESRELQPGEKFRDLEAVNELCPQSEWRDAFGKMKGPWERQYVIEFVDLETMDQFSWPTSTVGGGIAANELVDRVNKKRRYENRNDLWPYVRLSHCFMKTQWKGRERPDLKITGWYSPPKSEVTLEAAPVAPQLPPASEPVQPQPASSTPDESPPARKYELSSGAFEPVTPPVSLQEEMKDKIAF